MRFPSRSEQSFDIRLKLSQISRPTVLLHKNDSDSDSEGEVEKNSLSYDITWNQVPATERQHIGGYEITVNRSSKDKEATSKYDKKMTLIKTLKSISSCMKAKVEM